MTGPRVLIAGVGNIFCGDDAFGCEVARELLRRPLPNGVRAADFGIRGLDLAYALLDGCDSAILADALPRGELPGTLFVLEPDLAELEQGELALDPHGMQPLRVLRLVLALGGRPPPLRVVGCEPATLGTEEEPALGLSEPVRQALPEAVRLIERLAAEFVNEGAWKGESHVSR